jgi:hypothetical protein
VGVTSTPEPGSPEAITGPRLYVALVHYPVKDRAGETVTTSVTNLDVHDIARSARTYGVRRYYLITPIELQHTLVRRILEHWTSGSGRKRMPERWDALSVCEPVLSLEDALADVERREGERPQRIATAARATEGRALTSVPDARARIAQAEHPYLLILGTGHGLADELLRAAEHQLEPLDAGAGYNHLSVRAAAAIYLDRLLSPRAELEAGQSVTSTTAPR